MKMKESLWNIKKSFSEFIGLLKKFNKNVLFLLFFTFMITLTRNVLEYYGSHKTSNFGLTIYHLLNTHLYVLLMIFVEGLILNWILMGNKKQLRRLIQEGSILLFLLFIIIPVFNTIFNYNFFNIPSSFHNIPFLIYPHYGPVGIHIAFILTIFYFPLWLKRIYNLSYLYIFKRNLILYFIHYVIYYQVTMYFFDVFLVSKGATFFQAGTTWTVTFIIPVLVLFPFFIKKYSINLKEIKILKVAYFLMLLITLWLILNMFVPTTRAPPYNPLYNSKDKGDTVVNNVDLNQNNISYYINEKTSFIDNQNNLWNFYFMILEDNNHSLYYGTLFSASNIIYLKILNKDSILVEFQDKSNLILNEKDIIFSSKGYQKFLLNASLLYNTMSLDSEKITLEMRSNSLGNSFWWNSKIKPLADSQFKRVKGYDDFVTFDISIHKNNKSINLTGKGIHELMTINEELKLRWDVQYWFYFIIDNYCGIYIQYDDYIDGAVFSYKDSKEEDIEKFEIFKYKNRSLIQIKTKTNLFEFDLTPKIITKPYINMQVYSPSCNCSGDILHKIYKLNKGKIIINNKEKNFFEKGYFQLETLHFEDDIN